MPAPLDQVKKNLIKALSLDLPYGRSKQKETRGRDSAVIALIGLDQKNKPHLFYAKRLETLPSHPGQVSFPGGIKEDSDSSARSCAIRETEEETAIQSQDYDILGELPPLFTYSTDFLIHPFVALLKDPIESQKIILSADEYDQYFWASLQNLEKNYTQKEFNLLGKKIPNHEFNVNNLTIWGATGAMTRNLLDRMNQVVIN